MKKSSGLILYRLVSLKKLEFFLVHPGGPYYRNKDIGSWSIPKGEFLDDQDPLLNARREFLEETGNDLNDLLDDSSESQFVKLKPQKQLSGKLIYAWALETNHDLKFVSSNTFEIEWPPKSGKIQEFPEVDKAEWFSFNMAIQKIHKGQIDFLHQVKDFLINKGFEIVLDDIDNEQTIGQMSLF